MTSPRRQTPEPLAIVSGIRTPFAKAFGPLMPVPADELAITALNEALSLANLKPEQIDEVVFGNVASPADKSNIARVIALKAGIPQHTIAHTVNRNCSSGMEAIITGWHAINEGRSDVVLVGGTESMSNVPLLWDRRMTRLLLQVASARSMSKRLGAWFGFRPSMLKPVPGLKLGLTDPTCGLNMGQTAEVLANDFGIGREEQDAFAAKSHNKAVAAAEQCFHSGEIVAVDVKGNNVGKDIGPRAGQSVEKLARLKPIFDPKNGTVTAGNACPITDGAVAMVLMSASLAKEQGLEPLGYVVDYAIAGCDPRRMGLGPVYATSRLLEQTGRLLKNYELVEINEAFAVQVMSCLKAMASDEFCKNELGRDAAMGDVDPETLNVNGGAIALGHPVGATGARLVLTLLRALKEQGKQRGLASLCVGGGQGYALDIVTSLD